MATPSSQEAWKALAALFEDSRNPQNLPDEAISTIEAYVAKHHDLEDKDAPQIQHELLDIHSAYVVPYADKRPMFLQLLHLLRPCIKEQSRVEEWWTLVLEPIVNGIGCKKIEIQRASDFLIGALDYDSEGEDKQQDLEVSSYLTDTLLTAWLRRTRVPSPEQETLTMEDQYIARQLEYILVEFGRRKPKDFMVTVDRLVVSRDTRLQALSLLSAFIRNGPPHLHTVTRTSLVENLLKCLMIDTSTTAISLALTNLLMFLPHIPTSVKIHLPRLFLIYSRLLCWDRFRPRRSHEEYGDEEEQEQDQDEFEDALEETEADQSWEKLESLIDNGDLTASELLHYFTFLYGLYPLNFMAYVRKPRKYLKNISFPNADEFDLPQTLIRTRTEQFRQIHALHPNFYTTTVEEELTDDGWLQSDPAAVVSECMALCLQTSAYQERAGPSPKGKLPDIPSIHKPNDLLPVRSLSNATSRLNTNWKSTPNTTIAESSENGSGKAVSVTHETSQGGASITQRQIAPSAYDASADSPTLPPMARGAPPSEVNMAYLQREVLLLRSDLNFERNVKQQHLARIGQLQRKNIKDASIEAETANLVSTTRALKAKLQMSTEAYSALKRETQTGRNHFKNWETDITTKMRVLVEDEQKWRADEEGLRTEVQKLTKDCELLRRLVVDREAKELLAQQKLSSIQIDLEQLDTLRSRVAELEAQVRKYEEKDLQYTQAKDEKEILETELATARLQLQSSITAQDRAQNTSALRISELQNRLQIAEGSDGIPPHIQQRINSIVTASEAKLQALKKEHANLRHRFVELEMRCQELEQEAALRSPEGLGSSVWSTAAETACLARYDSASQYTIPSLSASLNPGLALPTPKVVPASGLLRSGTVSSRPNSDARNFADSEASRESVKPSTMYTQSSSRFSMDSFNSASKDDVSSDAKKPRAFGRGGAQNLTKPKKDNGDEAGGSTGIAGSGGEDSSNKSKRNKSKEREKKESTVAKTARAISGLRGIRGIM